jgi:aminopeptidase-like protein
MNGPVVGNEIYALMEELFPIPRSLTGAGVRQTLARLSREIPLEVHEIPSGTAVHDWIVPNEWVCRRAYLRAPTGEIIADTEKNPLHLLSYSRPARTTLSLEALRPHLHSLPDRPNWIPYRTLYYTDDWGFAITHRQLESLAPGDYEVVIDTELRPGSLTYGELYFRGEEEREILISTYLCHPSLANDNLSGVALATLLARSLLSARRRYSYRFLFIPETIGSITWLSRNEEQCQKIAHGLVVTCVGDPGEVTYKKSRQGNAEIDRLVPKLLADRGCPHRLLDFFPMGSDERQYCSPGYNLPVGSLMRTPYGQFAEYHTSADNLSFVTASALEESFQRYWEVILGLEANRKGQNLSPKGEPQLGRRGLYSSLGGQTQQPELDQALLWLLNFSDGSHSLLDVAERSRLPFWTIVEAANRLRTASLLEWV